jgi:hypothetical protein
MLLSSLNISVARKKQNAHFTLSGQDFQQSAASGQDCTTIHQRQLPDVKSIL